MEPEHWRVLLIEDDVTVAQQSKALIERRPLGTDGQGAEVEIAGGFQSGLNKLATTRYDVVVLDIRDDSAASHEPEASAGDEATPADIGISLYEQIRSRRAVPVVFYSAVAHLVEDQAKPPFVTVISKLDENEYALREAVADAIDSRLPALNRALGQFTENVLRTYMQQFVEQHWNDLQEPQREPDLAHLLARRLAASLGDGNGLAAELASVPGAHPENSDDLAHPMRMYVIPPIGDLTTGDVLRGALRRDTPTTGVGAANDGPREAADTNDDDDVAVADSRPSHGLPPSSPAAARVSDAPDDYWVMLTPACDLVADRVKAQFVLLVGCSSLAEQDEVIRWLADPDTKNTVTAVDALLANNRRGGGQADRYHALPPAWNVPGLLVDFQRVVHVPYDSVRQMTRIATLDDPYAQSLVARFTRYLNRIGTPDVDPALVRERLRSAT